MRNVSAFEDTVMRFQGLLPSTFTRTHDPILADSHARALVPRYESVRWVGRWAVGQGGDG
jgi:hypothetical protein